MAFFGWIYGKRLTIAIVASSLIPALAQTPAKRPSTAATQAREEELAKVQELLADPSPNARLANLEDIIASGDATKLQLALRITFRSDDPLMRNLGMRALIASLKELIFDIVLPPQVQRQYESAEGDADKIKDLSARYPYLRPFASRGFRLKVFFTKFDASKSGGMLDGGSSGSAGSFTISGDRLAGTFRPSFTD